MGGERDVHLRREGDMNKPDGLINPPSEIETAELLSVTPPLVHEVLRRLVFQRDQLATKLESQAAELNRLKQARMDSDGNLCIDPRTYQELIARAEAAERERDEARGLLFLCEKQLESGNVRRAVVNFLSRTSPPKSEAAE